jgi:hypothetical protein
MRSTNGFRIGVGKLWSDIVRMLACNQALRVKQKAPHSAIMSQRLSR